MNPGSSPVINGSRWFSRKVFFWSLYDFANTTCETIIFTLVFAVYFKEVVAGNLPIADFYWASGINISMILVAVLSPVLGAAADYYGNKKMFLGFFSVLCVVTTAMMYFITKGMILQSMILFVLYNIGFQGGLTFYNSFLKEITAEKNYNKVSSAGYAIGYLGSLASLAIAFTFRDNVKIIFVSSAVLFVIFALPLFLFIKEIPVQNNEDTNRNPWLLIRMVLIGQLILLNI